MLPAGPRKTRPARKSAPSAVPRSRRKSARIANAPKPCVHTARWEQFEYDRRITDWELHRGFERY